MEQTAKTAEIPVRILRDGGTIPVVGMGTFGSDRYTPEQVAEAVRGGIQAGYRLFDCAACYGNEDKIGVVLEEAMEQEIVRREELFITTKVWNDMHGKGDVLLSCARSLRDLRLDYVDLFFVHWPFPNYHAPFCDGDSRNPNSKPFSVEEFMGTWRQCERLVDMGLTRYIGMSNMTIPKLEAVLPLCRIQPAAIEMELHPCFQQPELFDYCVRRGIQPIGHCPMGSPSRPDRDKTAEDLADMEMPEVQAIARAHGIHPALVCLKWAVARGQIPIPFSVKKEQYIQNLRCVLEDPLTEEEMERMKSVDRNNRLIKGQVFLWPTAQTWQDLWDPAGTICQ